jgi:dihydroorotase
MLEHVYVFDDTMFIIILRAQLDKGIVFDLGHGQGSFDWEVAEAAAAAGIWPDTVSTDLHSGNAQGPVYDLAFVASKMLHLGMSLKALTLSMTATPARVMRRYPQLGSLSAGAAGDITIFRLSH